jgi:hypothetical protein
MGGNEISPEGYYIVKPAGAGKNGQGYAAQLVRISEADFMLLTMLEKSPNPGDEVASVDGDLKNNVKQGKRVQALLSAGKSASIQTSCEATSKNLVRSGFDWHAQGRAWLTVSAPIPLGGGKTGFKGETTIDVFILRGKDATALQKSLELLEKNDQRREAVHNPTALR